MTQFLPEDIRGLNRVRVLMAAQNETTSAGLKLRRCREALAIVEAILAKQEAPEEVAAR